MNRPTPPEVIVPLVAEQASVQKVVRDNGGVLVTKHLETETVRMELPQFTEHVDVARVPIGRVVAGLIAPRQEGDTTVISVVEEVAVVEVRFVLKEEVRITKRRVDETKHVDVTLRREVADVRTRGPR